MLSRMSRRILPVRSLLALATIAALPAGEAAISGTARTSDLAAPEDVETVSDVRRDSALLRRRAALARAPQPTEILADQDFVVTPASTIPDRLRYVAGVDVYQTRHNQFEVGLRGWDGTFNNRVLVIADNRVFRNEELGGTVWSGSFFYSDLDRVEVVKGPSSVKFGSNAFGGVISLNSREVGDRFEMRSYGSIGDPHAIDGDVTVSGPLWRGTYAKFSAGFTELDDLPAPRSGLTHQDSTRTSTTGDTDERSTRWLGLVGWKLPLDQRLEASYTQVRLRPLEVVDGGAQGSARADIAIDTAQLELKGPRWNAYYQRQRYDTDYQNQKLNYDPSLDFTYVQFDFHDVRETAHAEVWLPFDLHQLSVGGEWTAWNSRSNMWKRDAQYRDSSTWGEVSTTNYALFAEDQWQVCRELFLTGGLRGDHHSEVGAMMSPRAAINWVPDAHQYVLFAYSSGYRLPSALEAFQQDYFLQRNPDLAAERIQALELAWKRTEDAGLSWSLGGFYNRANSLIWRQPLPYDQQVANFNNWLATGGPFDPTRAPGPVWQYANLDNPAHVLGTEADVRWRIPQSPLSLWANTTLQWFSYEHAIHFSSPGLTVPSGPTFYQYDFTLPRNVNGPPPWKINFGTDATQGPWFATAACRLVGGRQVFDIGHTVLLVNPQIAEQRLPSYAAVDLGVGWRYGADRANWVRLSVLDLFDSTHSEHYEATSTSLTNAGEDQLSSTVGRQIRLSAGMRF